MRTCELERPCNIMITVIHEDMEGMEDKKNAEDTKDMEFNCEMEYTECRDLTSPFSFSFTLCLY